MADAYGIDGHKLHLHPRRAADWLEAVEKGPDSPQAARLAPLYVEVSPSGACNHRCTFCALDYMAYAPRFLDADLMRERFADMGRFGVKSVLFGGEGEPLLYKRFPDLLSGAFDAGIDCALTSNAVLLSAGVSEQILPKLRWLKVSIGAGTADTYAKVHRTDAADFPRVLANLAEAARIKSAGNLSVTLGAQILLLPENAHEAPILARLCREAGLNYLVVKPYSQHRLSLTHRYEGTTYEDVDELAERLAAEESDDFQVIFRKAAMGRAEKPKVYGSCQATPWMWAYVDSGHNVCACSCFLSDPRFMVGDLTKKPLSEVWADAPRRELMRMLSNGGFDLSECRLNCRMDAVNAYLWRLRHPGEHDAFI